ncbi:OmpP1/FadL family transporter [Parabacteroides sp. FAFU027]|uniref:OmpP1/FadL family transporter n=1 Tax=Parabacteroides sp. FAFU027 TaxID=2922715 RepID=UPI001FAECA19|nr:outer membrane protein transport protein [Parabacteroides sp. FAFU027]
MKRLGLLSVCLMATLSSIFAQSEIDALKYSKTDLNGTARYMSMGGAFGALGGDISSLTNNPAGIGVYRTSEFAGTMNLNFQNTNSNWNGTNNTGNNAKFNFNNIAYIGTFKSNAEGFVNFNFGIGYNRQKDFYRNYEMHNTALNYSLSDYIAETTNRYNNNSGILAPNLDDTQSYSGYDYHYPWISVLGWNGYLIDPKNSSDIANNYKYSAIGSGIAPAANLKISERGYMDEYNISFGGNVYDVLYFGATVGITDLYYKMSARYDEDFSNMGGFTLNNFLETKGSGINFKAGVILRPTDNLRFGLAVHTPTYYKLTDYFDANVINDYADGSSEHPYNASPAHAFVPANAYSEYSLQTPMKLQASAAYIAGKKGILSFEYEYVDYRNMSMKDQDGYGWDANTYIKDDMRAGNNIKIGAEYRVTPQFSLRAGYANQSSPLNSNLINGNYEMSTFGATLPHYTLDRGTNYYTGGFGYRFGSVYTDLAFVSRVNKEDVYAFSPIGPSDNWMVPQKATLKTTNNQLLFTLGYKF